MVTGPATYIVMLIVGVLLVVGVFVLRSGRRTTSSHDDQRVCGQCGHRNVRRAKYCARCGNDLKR